MKKYLKFAVMAAFALVTVYNVHKVQTEVVLSDTQLKNVEAIATTEGPPFEIWVGAFLHKIKPGCSICKTRYPEDRCNIHDQLPDCYGSN